MAHDLRWRRPTRSPRPNLACRPREKRRRSVALVRRQPARTILQQKANMHAPRLPAKTIPRAKANVLVRRQPARTILQQKANMHAPRLPARTIPRAKANVLVHRQPAKTILQRKANTHAPRQQIRTTLQRKADVRGGLRRKKPTRRPGSIYVGSAGRRELRDAGAGCERLIRKCAVNEFRCAFCARR